MKDARYDFRVGIDFYLPPPPGDVFGRAASGLGKRPYNLHIRATHGDGIGPVVHTDSQGIPCTFKVLSIGPGNWFTW